MIFLLFVAGLFSGFINTLAGGGSALVMPLLIFAGLESPVANATNRIALLFQNISGVYSFNKHEKYKLRPLGHVLIATIIGGIAGSLLAVKINSEFFDKVIAVSLAFVVVMMLKPQKKSLYESNKLPAWIEFIIFLLIGFYGGFIQIGVGFILLASLNLLERMELIKANAVKVLIVLAYTIFSVAIFAISGMIVWKYALILSAGNMIGSYIGVRTAVSKGEKFIKIVIVIALIISVIKLLKIDVFLYNLI